MRIGLLLGLSALLVAACGCEPYGCPTGYMEVMGRCLDPDGGVPDGGPEDRDSGPCTPGAEVCNGADDDCDRTIDEAAASFACESELGARSVGAACVDGRCAITACSIGWLDCDDEATTGCEAELGSVETCTGCGDACGYLCRGPRCDDVASLALGDGHACGLLESGNVVCWGANTLDQLGDGSGVSAPRPIPLGALSGIVEVAANGSDSCARNADGRVWCWGGNMLGGPGVGTVALVTDAVSLTVGGRFYACAGRRSGDTVCWGSNEYGVLGGEDVDGDGMVITMPRVATRLASGRVDSPYSCGLVDGGRVWCWGLRAPRPPRSGSGPIELPGIVGATDIAVGVSGACALFASGDVLCLNGDATSPTALAGVGDAVSIAMSSAHGCVARRDGTAACWGSNSNGELGDGMMSDSTVPVPVRGVDDAARVVVGEGFSCAVTREGGLRCWGANAQGQLGDGTTTPRGTAAPVLPPM